MNCDKRIVVTGAAGFIGFHLSKKLLDLDYHILGIDNLNDYYDPELKLARLAILKKYPNFTFEKLDICDFNALKTCICNSSSYKTIIHLAAQAGVRYSLENPWTYIQNNILGHLNILEVCRGIKDFRKLIYASSSSVYGQQSSNNGSNNGSVNGSNDGSNNGSNSGSNGSNNGYSINDRVDSPVSLYAATKKADELMSFTYSHLYGINAIGLRFFTVVGPLGRPDMAPMLFTKKILAGEPINVFNYGNLMRDFTYVGDIVDGIVGVLNLSTDKEKGVHKIYNLGNHKSVKLLDFIEILEKHIGKKSDKIMLPMQKGDVYETFADITESERDFGYKPKTSLDEALAKLVAWYIDFYKERS
jgi:UDP-glucuronate 4-epimerase